MKKLCATLLLIGSACCLSAQRHTIDSLNAQLRTAEHDTTRAILYFRLAEQYLLSDADTAFDLAMQGLALSRQAGYKRGEMLGLSASGNILALVGNYPDALRYELSALKIAEEEYDYDWIAEICMNVSKIYFYQKDYPQTLNYINKARKLGAQLNNKLFTQVALENTGAVYIVSDKFDSALIYTQQAYSMAVELKLSVYNLLLNMGHTYSGLGQTSLALEYFRAALPEIIQEGNAYYLSEAYLGMAKVFEKTGHDDSSLYYARKSFVVADQRKYLQGCFDAANYLTGLYKKLKNSDSAFYYSEEAKTANDSLFSQQKMNQIQSITLGEQLRLREMEEAERVARVERKHNLQYAAIALGIIGMLLLFLLLSHSIIVNQNVIRFLAALSLLIVFEFINLLLHPFLAHVTHHSPVFMLGAMVCIAAMLIPLHHKLEHWMTHRLVEKNNRIRLAAARKTIAELEGQGAV